MSNTFCRQFAALFRKNWVVLSKHPLLNILRCFILPIAYGVFLAMAQLFLNRPNNFGIGEPIPVYSLESQFTVPSQLLWMDATDGTSSPSPSQVISRITSSFTLAQRQHVKEIFNLSDIPLLCPENFNWISECFGVVVFNDIPVANAGGSVDYVIMADAGLFYVDVQRHTSDYEKKVLPLQWAIDKAIIELQTGIQQQTPLEWPFTQETNAQQFAIIRLNYINTINSLLVLAFFVCYIGIAYQLPGGIAGERASGLTAHMKAMGLLDSARFLSWHVCISLAYLPAWIAVGLVWHYRIFSSSNAGLVLIVHILLGLTLASWSFFIAAPFGKSPQLAAVVTTFVSILFAVFAVVFKQATNGTAFVFTLLFPPGFYVFAIRAISGRELAFVEDFGVELDPMYSLTLLPQLVAAIIDVFLWPCVAVLLERYLYDAAPSGRFPFLFWRGKSEGEEPSIPPNVAISVKNLRKTFRKPGFSFRSSIVAIDDISFDVPRRGIFVLLGLNGAGKSTALSIMGGLSGSSGGSVIFEGGKRRPPRGTIGLVPQKNILFPDLTCMQNLGVWQAVKWSENTDRREDLMQLLRDCDLEAKAHSNANTLSGGQKRKLQLAAGLVGGSRIVLVDECTSGVDPLSRRSLWRTLIAVRDSRTIVFTTHFLDEADLLADEVAIIVAPGRLVAQGTPVALKRDLGKGYSLQVTFNTESEKDGPRSELLQQIRVHAQDAQANDISPMQALYRLNSRDVDIVAHLLRLLAEEKARYGIVSFDVLGTSFEDVFLRLVEGTGTPPEVIGGSNGGLTPKPENLAEDALAGTNPVVHLSEGRSTSFLAQAITILYKRFLILRRSWLAPLLTVLVAVAGSTIPIVFIKHDFRTCATLVQDFPSESLFPPYGAVVESPPGIITSTLWRSSIDVLPTDVPDIASFLQTISTNYLDLSVGGISIDLTTGGSLVAWEASPPGMTGPTMLNLVTNILYNHALNISSPRSFRVELPTIIDASFQPLSAPYVRSFNTLKWAAFFGATMSVFPAFFALYVSKERQSSVQAMQFSNGLTNPLGLWLGHLMFDTIWTLVLSTLITIIFASFSSGFYGLGFLWFVLVLYGITGALFAYCASLVVSSPLAGFALVAGYQIVMFLLYFSAYLLVLTFGKTAQASRVISIIHWTLSLASPVANVLRAALISLNLFSLLCNGTTEATTPSPGQLQQFGGPILYLILYSCVLLAVLFWASSGSVLPLGSFQRRKQILLPEDVAAEANTVDSSNDRLRVVQISKQFNGRKAVDNVSFGVPHDTIFALVGPNGAGKTTIFNMIRGDTLPDAGNIFITGTSVVRHPRIARRALGVCPQFTAVDAQMTVRQHLVIYGRLKGLASEELDRNVEVVMRATSLDSYANLLANKLSGGNKRKLSLAIALIGNPSVLLIDEFSTGIDAKMKRDMWNTLRQVAIGKAVILTTHSMEEASSLASKVGILATRLLAIGSAQSLCDRYAAYEVHFSCRTREDLGKVQKLMARIPGSRMADDLATRFEIPISRDASGDTGALSLPQLFGMLTANRESEEDIEFTVEKGALESVFLKIIRENNVCEEDMTAGRKWWRFCTA